MSRSSGLVGLALIVLVSLPASVSSARRTDVQPPFVAAVEPSPLFGIVSDPGPPEEALKLARIDPVSLGPLGSERVPLGLHSFGWSFSPDGSRLVLGSDGSAELRFVDVEHMTALGDLRVAQAGFVGNTAWVNGNVLALVQEPGCCSVGTTSVVLVDPRERRILRRTELDGGLVRAARTGQGYVLLLAPPHSIGPAVLAVVHADGSAQTVPLDEILAGIDAPAEYSPRSVAWIREPALVVGGAAGRAFVISASGNVADIDLDSLTVEYHTLSARVSLLGRLRNWLEPAASAKAIDGPVRRAVWLGDGLIALAGIDYSHWLTRKGEVGNRSNPAGLDVIDTRSWSVRALERGADDFHVVGRQILATGSRWNPKTGRRPGMGLAAYGPDGRRQFRLFAGQGVFVDAVLGRRAFVNVPDKSWLRIVDLATGRVVGRWEKLPYLLVPGTD